MIDVECGSCGKRFRVKDEYGGRRIKCPGCGGSLAVPFQVVLPIDTADPEVSDPPPAPAPPREPTVGERLAALESANASLRRSLGRRTWALAAAVAALAVAGLWAYHSIDGQFGRTRGLIVALLNETGDRVVSAKGFLLRDQHDKVRASLSMSLTGEPVLLLMGSDGSRTELGDRGKPFDGPSLVFRNAKGTERLTLYSRNGEHGPAGLVAVDDEHNVKWTLEHSPASGSALSLSNTNDSEANAIMIMGNGGYVDLQLIDGKGKHVFDAAPAK